jgi:hypothetical protein
MTTKTITWIEDRIAEGRTVYITTALRVTKITPKTFHKFAANGTPVFKDDGTSTYMIRGNHYDCIDFTKITAR